VFILVLIVYLLFGISVIQDLRSFGTVIVTCITIIIVIRPHHPYYLSRCGLLLPTE